MYGLTILSYAPAAIASDVRTPVSVDPVGSAGTTPETGFDCRCGRVRPTQNAFLAARAPSRESEFQRPLVLDLRTADDDIGAADGSPAIETPAGVFTSRHLVIPAVSLGDVPLATVGEKMRRIAGVTIAFHFTERSRRDRTIFLSGSLL